MKWESPWGTGYPGWHLECTAMSTKYLGKKFDIHTGGIEHIGVHHTNEIAQGYGAYGSQTANFWLHNGWLVEKSGEKMSKSKGGFVTVQELVKKGYSIHYWRTKSKAEVDFIIEDRDEIIPLEVKTTLNKPSVSRSFRSFLEKYAPPRGFITSQQLCDEIRVNDIPISIVPHWHFDLQGT